ncbi:MAG: PLP-dependent aminotransferase family protein, partial [Verrucomicrobiia bacterium]
MKSALSQLGRRTAPPPVSWLMSTSLARPRLISLAAGFTDNPTLPVDEARNLLMELLSDRCTGEPALQYGSTRGLPALIELTAARIQCLEQKARNNSADKERFAGRLVITHGSQQLLYLVTEVLCDPGDIVLLEDPTYFVYLGIVQSHGLHCRGVQLETDGIDLSSLDKTLGNLKKTGALPRLKLLYLVTYHQNPTGTTTAFNKKQAALDMLQHYEKWAGHPIYLFEDAAYRELGFEEETEPSALKAIDAAERVIYAGTYSKPFATGVRVGYGLLPKPVRDAVIRVKGNHDFGTANLLQHLLARAISSGTYDAHLELVRRRYAEKADCMISAIRTSFSDVVQWRKPKGGMYVWVALPKTVKTGLRSKFFACALDHDVLYVPGQICYAPDPQRPRPNHEMRLSYGNATTDEIKEGIARLSRVIGECLA